jgi:hypothetical protein
MEWGRSIITKGFTRGCIYWGKNMVWASLSGMMAPRTKEVLLEELFKVRGYS